MRNEMTLESGRLELRRWREEDADALFRYASDPLVSELAMWPTHTSRDMSLYVIREIFMPNPYTLAMVLKETSEPIGCIGLVPQGDEHYPAATAEREVGYWIGRRYWNAGLTTEALEALISFCRDGLRLKSLLITTDARNVASQRVAQKCGFRFIEDFDCDGIRSKAFRLTL